MEKKAPKILVFSTEKISDPAIDLAGLLKLHYPPIVLTVEVPCSSAVKSKWILHAFDQGFDGVFIAADGTDCAYDESCTEKTGQIISQTHELMREKGIPPEKLKMAAICSVCAESFVKQMNVFADQLSEQ